MNKKLMALWLILGGCASSPHKQAEPAVEDANTMYMLVGSYATPDEEGIKVYRFNQETGETEYVSGLKGLSNPSYLVPSSDGKRVYSVGEDEDTTASAIALSFDAENGRLALLNRQLTGGGAPCHIALTPKGNEVITANYLGGSITRFALDGEGRLQPEPQLTAFTGKGLHPERQAQPHLHYICFTPDEKYLLATDLGTDVIHVFPADGKAEARRVSVEPGSGPRHLCFHPNRKFAYLMNEISGKVTAFAYDDGQLDPLQYIEADTVGAQGSADIHLSPDGKFLYASNRLKADGLAIFAVDSVQGTLTRIGYQPTGIHPRNFILSPNGKYVLVACRDSHTVQLFSRDAETGLLTDTGKEIHTSKPVCLKFIR